MSDWFPERPRPGGPQRERRLWSFGEQPAQNREKIVIHAVLYSAGALVCSVVALVALVQIIGGDTGFIVMLFFFGIPGAIIGGFARQYLLDVRAEPVAVEGEVIRKWQKGNLFIFFMPSYYIYVANKIFSIRRQEYAMLLPGDLVRVTCFPHSLTVENLERYDSSTKQYVPAASGALH